MSLDDPRPNHKSDSTHDFRYIESPWPAHARDDLDRSGVILFLVGIGILPAREETGQLVRYHITPQAERTLRECNQVLHLTPYDDALTEMLAGTPATLTDLNHTYASQSTLDQSIDAVADQVFNAADSASTVSGTSIAFVTYGNALYGDSVSTALIGRNFARGNNALKFQVIPGVSSFDTVAADLLMNPAAGLQIHDMTTLYTQRYAIETRLPLLLLQPEVFWQRWSQTTQLLQGNPQAQSLLADFSAFLAAEGYPPDHKVFFRHSNAGLRPPSFEIKDLAELMGHLQYVEHGVSLLIPGI